MTAIDFKKNQIIARITELQFNLEQTNYVDNKLIDALVEYVVYENKDKVLSVHKDYAEIISKRKEWREEKRILEKQLAEEYGG